MAEPRRFRPAHLIALVLLAPPMVKLVEWAWPSGPGKIDSRAVAAGRDLFNHEWTVNDPLSSGDGLGPVFNASSCVACHSQGGAGGGGPVEHNVTVYGLSAAFAPAAKTIPPIGVVHTHAIKPEFQERLNLVNAHLPSTPSIPLDQLIDRTRTVFPTGITVTQRNTPALFGDGLLDAIPEEALHAEQRRNSDVARLVGLSRAKDSKVRGRVARLPNGRIGRFGWKAEFASLDDFVRAACANELGLSNPSRAQATSLARTDYQPKGTDLSDAQCVLIGDYLRELPAPVQVAPFDPAEKARVNNGANQFAAIGCADCHTADLGPIKGFYSNLLLHDMGSELASSTGYYGEPPAAPGSSGDDAPPIANEWRTPPLWGVADSGPYLHDGRAKTLEQSIALHGGEASNVVAKFSTLPRQDQDDLIAFLKTLRRPGGTARSRSREAFPGKWDRMSVETLDCPCGMRLRLPGAVPGRVGKCPRCGSLIKVPGPPEPAVKAEPGEPARGRATFVKVRVEDRKGKVAPTSGSDGFVGTPSVAETRFRDSVFYPLWNASGLSVLAFMPVGLWFATAPLFALVPTFRSNSPFSVLGLILLLPQLLLLFVVAGYTLLFLGQVLVTSALGEVVQPRLPGWSLSEIGEGLGRWFWALVVGGVVGGLPTLVYWINCGDIDWLDRIVLVDLVIPGLAYAQMALLAALIYESPLAANPITVARAIRRVGWAYVGPCVMTGSTLLILVGLFAAVLQIRDPIGQTVAYWGFWVVSIYAAMVVLRRLGLFCYRHAVVLEWFPDRRRDITAR